MIKLKTLTLNQAILLRDALEIINPDSMESIDDKRFLLCQLDYLISEQSTEKVED